MSGVLLYGWLVKERAALARHVIFVTAEEQKRPSPVIETGLPVLQKPVSRTELLAAIGSALGSDDSVSQGSTS
jgi:hypothetical protein